MKNNKIIVVEDELAIALDIKVILLEAGYEPIINITSVEEAIQSIEENNPILVLIDINLNKKQDGIEVGKYLLEKNKTPYLYVTSFSDKVTLDRVNTTRPHGYLVKPFKPSDLITTVSIVLNKFEHKEIDQIASEDTASDFIPYRMRMIINYINENIDRKIELEELIEISTWKKRHFSRLFLSYLHMSPYQYILTRKIDRAKSLLEETDLQINEIAIDLAFQSYSNFCNAFKKIVGYTPEKYRRKYSKV